MEDRRQTARPMATSGFGALPCMTAAAKPWSIARTATYLPVHAWVNAASLRSKGPIGDRTG
jgi:hypothetical protein